MSTAMGELEILVDGARVYSYKSEGGLPSESELLSRILTKSQ